MRWTLGASDIMFTNPYAILTSADDRSIARSVFSWFFRNGQVLETFRGKGIYQPSIDTAIAKLDQGEWVGNYRILSRCNLTLLDPPLRRGQGKPAGYLRRP